MKAWVLHGAGDFCLETVKEPVLAEDEVLLSVRAAGICGSDLARVYGTGAYFYPLVPGHEFSGTVEALGGGADRAWLSKRVGVFPLIPCKSCLPCQKKQYELCRNYSYLGSRRAGGFAEYVAVPAKNLIEIPDQVSFEEAAMLEPMAVAVHAMRRAFPRQADTVAICGLGTIGLLLAMFLMEAGIRRILVIGNKEFQRRTVQNLGLPKEHYCDAGKQDIKKWFLEHTNGAGVDLFFECVGKNETFVQAIDLTAPSGKVMLVGNPHSGMALSKEVYWKILRNQLTVAGSWNSSFTQGAGDDWHYALDRLAKRQVAPADFITHRYPLDHIIQGFEIMKDKTEDYIKIMAIAGE